MEIMIVREAYRDVTHRVCHAHWEAGYLPDGTPLGRCEDARDRGCEVCEGQEIPMTREAAIEALVEQDVDRWGESEREASRRQHASRSYGRALNELANRAELSGNPDPDLRAAATAALTDSDWGG